MFLQHVLTFHRMTLGNEWECCHIYTEHGASLPVTVNSMLVAETAESETGEFPFLLLLHQNRPLQRCRIIRLAL